MATPRDILIAPGVGNYVITCNNSTDAIKPGHIVTTTGETADTNNVAWPDLANDVVLGVVGCAPGHDIDTEYSTGDMVPVYVAGSMAEVWVRVGAAAGALKRGDWVEASVAADGLAVIATDEPIVVGLEKVGRAAMESPDDLAERWCKVRLCAP